jgi:hypothetical protein
MGMIQQLQTQQNATLHTRYRQPMDSNPQQSPLFLPRSSRRDSRPLEMKKTASHLNMQLQKCEQQGGAPSQGPHDLEMRQNAATNGPHATGDEGRVPHKKKTPNTPTCQESYALFLLRSENEVVANKLLRKHKANTCK